MTDVTPYVPLSRCVAYFLDEYNKSSGDEDKAWVMAFRSLVDLGFNISAEPKSVRLPVAGNKTVQFPPDLLTWTKIGILNNNGEISTLKINNGLTLFKDNNPNRLEQITPDIDSAIPTLLGTPYYINYYNNGYYNTLFGIGGGLIQYGECRVDPKNRLIVLSPDFQYPHIVIEYLSSPEKDRDYQIQIHLQEAVVAFIAWKFKLAPAQEYYDRCIEARRRLPGKKATLSTINQVIREATGQYLKS